MRWGLFTKRYNGDSPLEPLQTLQVLDIGNSRSNGIHWSICGSKKYKMFKVQCLKCSMETLHWSKHFKYWPLAILGPMESSSKYSMFNMFNGESPLQIPQAAILGLLKYFELQKVQNVGKGVGWWFCQHKMDWIKFSNRVSV